MLKHKQYVGKAETDGDERTVTAIISDDSVDRDNEVLIPKGINVEGFMKNPVVLWAHDHGGEPIGKALWIKKGQSGDNKVIRAKVQFADTDKGNDVFKLFKGGFLNAFSVGFKPTKGHAPTPDEIKKRPELAEAFWIFDNWELLEFSAVPVPANPNALATAVKTKAIEVSNDTLEDMSIVGNGQWWETTTDTSTFDGNVDCAEIKIWMSEHGTTCTCGKDTEPEPIEVEAIIEVEKPKRHHVLVQPLELVTDLDLRKAGAVRCTVVGDARSRGLDVLGVTALEIAGLQP